MLVSRRHSLIILVDYSNIPEPRPPERGGILHATQTVPQLYFKKAGYSPKHLNTKLVNFVRTRKFAAADQLRIHLIHEGVEITPHPVYEQAAISCLRWDNIRASISDFKTWFFLIPACDPMDQSRRPLLETDADHFRDLRRILFASPSTRFPVILLFGIMAATKGYIQPMVNETLPVLIRYASANVGAIWLREMEQAITLYTAATPYLSDTVNDFRDLSIKVCCQAGWLSNAMAILTKNPQFELTTSTRTLLNNALRHAGRMEELSMLDRRVHPQDSWQPRSTTPSGDVEAFPRRPRKSSNAKGQSPSVSALSRHSMAVEVRFINRQLRDSNELFASNITVFLSRLRKVGGASRIVQWLRERALVAGLSCGIPWLEGELRYHLTQRSYDEVLKLYLAHFNTEAQLPSLFSNALSAITSLYRFTIPPAASPEFILSQRWMVLKSIIRLIPTLQEPLVTLRVLYDAYGLERVDHAEAYNVRPAFIASFGECGAPDDAVRVLKDSGKAPYSKEVETLAGVLAHAGRAEKALALLRHAESGKMEMTLVNGRAMCVQARPSMYERVIRGFVTAGLLKPAMEVETMMRAKFGQDSSRSKIHTEVIEALRALEAQCTPK
ncbi:hypothetical protein C0995_003638 [Termitomyces sp. Mi166|nr:hypothetical protein C0995_003638 [Termitomyces sp. Mi166\